MNKKGFTLIEILAIVVIIGVVAVIAIPNITKQADEHAAKESKLVEEQIINAAKMYFSGDSERIKVLFNNDCLDYNGSGAKTKCEVSIDTLIQKELLILGNNNSGSFKKVYINRDSTDNILRYNILTSTGKILMGTPDVGTTVTTVKTTTKTTSDVTSVSITNQEALLLTANAYYKQGKQVQYDSYKRNLKCTAEDATSKHYCYVNCSGFVHMVYKYALNKEIPSKTIDLINYNDYIDYKADIKDNKGLAQFFLDNIGNIQSGDVIVWETKGGSRHTMLVEKVEGKNIYIIQAGGGAAETEGRYNVTTSEDVYDSYGALSKEYINIKTKADNKTAVSMSIGTKDNRDETFFRKKVKILRFWDDKGTKATKSSETRKRFNDIYIAKIVTSSNNQNYARVFQDITYSIKIKNEGADTYKDIYIEETIDDTLVELKSNSISKGEFKVVDNKKIEAYIPSLKKGEEITLKYTVTVKDKINSIIKSEGVVGTKTGSGKIVGIKTSKIETLIGKGLTEEQKTKLWNVVKELKSGTSIASRRFIQNLYLDTLGIDLRLVSNGKVVSNNEFITYDADLKKDTDKVKYASVSNSIKAYLYSNYYGLKLVDTDKLTGADKELFDKKIKDYYQSTGTVKDSAAWKQDFYDELNDRARTITKDMLEDGDVILTSTSGGDAGYIFFKDTLYKYDGKLQTLSGDDLFIFLNNLVGRNYIILRPYK